MKTNATLVLLALAVGAVISVNGMCGTDQIQSETAWKKRYDIPCQNHECDHPEIRDLYLLNSESPLINIRLNLVYFGDLSGENKTNYDAQIEFFQRVFLQQMNVTWNISTTVVTDRNQTVWGSADPYYTNMHLEIARDFYVPNQITLLCVTFEPYIGTKGYAYMPQWVPKNLVDPSYWYGIIHLPTMLPHGTVIIHEIGHMLGLLHTFSSSYEGNKCSKCSDTVNSTNHDVVGDLCSDTKPTPILYQCDQTAGNDCNGQWYGNTSFLPQDNYMGYAWDCPARFTPQQVARARCYLDRLINFVVQKDDADEPVATPEVPPTPIQGPVVEPNTNVPVVSNPIGSPSSTIEPISTSEPSSVNEPSSLNPVRSPTGSSIVSTGSRIVMTTLLGLVCVLSFIL